MDLVGEIYRIDKSDEMNESEEHEVEGNTTNEGICITEIGESSRKHEADEQEIEDDTENEELNDVEDDMEERVSETISESEYEGDVNYIRFGEMDYEVFLRTQERMKLKCVCFRCENSEDHLRLLKDLSTWEPNQNHINCFFDNIIRAYNHILVNNNGITPETLAFTDLFYRLRHECLSKLVMLALNFPITETDMKFSDFGINSDRTPDLIKRVNNTLLILEISASSSFERAAQNKGLESMGFESKYQRELNILDNLSSNYLYVPIIFDMSNPYAKQYLDSINSLKTLTYINTTYMNLLESYKREFCFLTINMKEFLSPSSAVIFSSDLEVTADHDDLEFLFSKEKYTPSYYYEEIVISPQVYSRLNNLWFRVTTILNSFEMNDNDHFFLVFNVKDYRLSYLFDRTAPTVNDYLENYDLGNKLFFFKNLKIMIGNVYKDSTDSEQGVKFLERVEIGPKKAFTNEKMEEFKLPLGQNHDCTNVLSDELKIELEYYKIRYNQYNTYNYNPR